MQRNNGGFTKTRDEVVGGCKTSNVSVYVSLLTISYFFDNLQGGDGNLEINVQVSCLIVV